GGGAGGGGGGAAGGGGGGAGGRGGGWGGGRGGRGRRGRPARAGGLVSEGGPRLEEIVVRAKDETGLEPPVPPEPLAWAPMESSEDALRRVREHGDRQMTQTE